MSCKNILEKSTCSHNVTNEIENEIKEMNIVSSYKRTGCSLQPNRSYNPIFQVETENTEKNRLSQKIKNMKSARSHTINQKAFDKTMFQFPSIYNKNQNIKLNKLISTSKKNKVKELKVNMYEDHPHNCSRVINEILNSPIRSCSRETPKQQTTLAKHKSETDIFKNIRNERETQQNNFISEIQNYRSCNFETDDLDEGRNYNSKGRKGPIAKTIDLKAYIK